MNPKKPVFPPPTQALVDTLNRIIDTEPDRRELAYALLTRVCVLWAPSAERTFGIEFDDRAGLLKFDSDLLADTIRLMNVLFPDGAGLPEQEGCGPL